LIAFVNCHQWFSPPKIPYLIHSRLFKVNIGPNCWNFVTVWWESTPHQVIITHLLVLRWHVNMVLACNWSFWHSKWHNYRNIKLVFIWMLQRIRMSLLSQVQCPNNLMYQTHNYIGGNITLNFWEHRNFGNGTMFKDPKRFLSRFKLVILWLLCWPIANLNLPKVQQWTHLNFIVQKLVKYKIFNPKLFTIYFKLL
jgi:hypothetical protein